MPSEAARLAQLDEIPGLRSVGQVRDDDNHGWGVQWSAASSAEDANVHLTSEGGSLRLTLVSEPGPLEAILHKN